MFRQKAIIEPLDNVDSEPQLLALCEAQNNTYFTNYYRERAVKENQFKAALDFVGIDLTDKVFLDIGPGTGDSLNVARERGCARTIAVDRNPYFAKLMELRGHEVQLINYMIPNSFGDGARSYFPLVRESVDFVYHKGAINCAMVNRGCRLSVELLKNILRGFDFNKWVAEIVGLIKPGGHVFFMPAPGQQSSWIEDPSYPVVTDYWVDDIKAWQDSYFSRVLQKHGFTVVSDIKGLTHSQAYPIGFHLAT